MLIFYPTTVLNLYFSSNSVCVKMYEKETEIERDLHIFLHKKSCCANSDNYFTSFLIWTVFVFWPNRSSYDLKSMVNGCAENGCL